MEPIADHGRSPGPPDDAHTPRLRQRRADDLPLTFREELLARVMPELASGECCSLIGTSGVGKSNLAQFLRRRDIQERYWGDGDRWLVLVDTHSLVFGKEPAEYLVAELMVHRLLMEAERRTPSGELQAWMHSLHRELISQPSAHLALRHLERICARLCDVLGVQLIFVFDQFEDIWAHVSARFFLNLRNLRDQFKYDVVYLVITRERLQRMRVDLREVEAFWELFASHVHGLGMYSEADATIMIERIENRRGVAVSPALRREAIELSGRHPGLLRAVFWMLQRGETLTHEPKALVVHAPIAEECAKIWGDCSADEQRLMRIIVEDLPLRDPNRESLIDLQLKELIVGEPLQVFSPLLAAFIRQQPGAEIAGVVVDLQRRQVWLDGQPLLQELSALEFKLLAYLASNADTVCLRDDLMRELYGEDMFDASDERLSALMSRLRSALQEDGRNPRYLITHRGVGVRLTNGRVLR
jgi:DNA-binding winged helix-turn-helix (wHTH) protein